jgi:hypothetical protein
MNGFTYIPNFITDKEEKDLISYLDSQTWDTTLSRRTQMFGFRYSYKHNLHISNDNIQPFTRCSVNIPREKLQIIVNEYKKGQSISAHIDDIKQFGNTIIGISLGNNCEMIFERGEEKNKIVVEQNSMYKMENECRYKWKHSIKPIKSHRRISITFREQIKV